MIGRIWAVAAMTLKEASRRKVFTILLLFAVALLSCTFFFPSIPIEGRLRLLEIWSLRASAVFTAIVGLFLAGFSLPTDFEQKRIYLLVSKPISKPAIFIGRYVGYSMLLAVFIASMGVVTLLTLRTVQALSGPGFPEPVAYPRVAADDFTGTERIEGGGASHAAGAANDGSLAWTFRGLRTSDFPDSIRIQSRLIFGAVNDPYRSSGRVLVRAAGTGRPPHEQAVSMNTNEERIFQVPASAVGTDGSLEVVFRCGDPDGRMGGAKEWMELYEKPAPFELAFLRGLGLILLQSMIVLSMTLMASTFLSAPLSILLGILLYVVGSIHGYARDGTRDIDRSLGELKASPEKKRRTPEDLPEWALRTSSLVTKVVLRGVPDFDHFDYSKWLLKDHVVSWRELGRAAKKALPPILVLAVLGTLVMTFKDFDR